MLRHARSSRARLPVAAALAAAAAAVVLGSASEARADASAWVFAGGGTSTWKQGSGSSFETRGQLTFDIGVGTTPDAPFVFGGLFRLQPLLGVGTDLGALARVATQGYQAGTFGLAVDAGAYARPWGTESVGFVGDLSLGAPLGFTLTLQGSAGQDEAVAFGAYAGLDFARLTVYRQSLLEWWPNPLPAQRAKTARR